MKAVTVVALVLSGAFVAACVFSDPVDDELSEAPADPELIGTCEGGDVLTNVDCDLGPTSARPVGNAGCASSCTQEGGGNGSGDGSGEAYWDCTASGDAEFDCRCGFSGTVATCSEAGGSDPSGSTAPRCSSRSETEGYSGAAPSGDASHRLRNTAEIMAEVECIQNASSKCDTVCASMDAPSDSMTCCMPREPESGDPESGDPESGD